MAKVEELTPQQLSETNLKPRGRVYPSPVNWRDQFLYQLILDRFSDDNEHQRELFDHTNPSKFQVKDKADWMAAGTKFVGGTLRGIQPKQFFDLYSENNLAGEYRQIGTYHVSILDDDDMSFRTHKQRFAANSNVPNLYEQVAHAVGVQLTTPGIPAIYYGTEQAFDGNEGYHDNSIEDGSFAEDRYYIKEAMFGGAFGAFQTADCHFFDIDHPTYLRIAAIARIRNSHDKIGKALRRGHHYLRETSFYDSPFSIPGQGELVAWSQTLFDTEVLMVLNTNGLENRGAEVTVDTYMHPPDSTMTFLYKSDWSDSYLRYPPRGQTVAVQHHDDRRATVRIDLPPSGMAILA
ncbi:hypothetical protein LC612_03650 [Nostoc sp. CHAB 5834]|nr:hypothetical protein [Nostoc sp. CHAB 5834]